MSLDNCELKLLFCDIKPRPCQSPVFGPIILNVPRDVASRPWEDAWAFRRRRESSRRTRPSRGAQPVLRRLFQVLFITLRPRRFSHRPQFFPNASFALATFREARYTHPRCQGTAPSNSSTSPWSCRPNSHTPEACCAGSSPPRASETCMPPDCPTPNAGSVSPGSSASIAEFTATPASIWPPGSRIGIPTESSARSMTIVWPGFIATPASR